MGYAYFCCLEWFDLTNGLSYLCQGKSTWDNKQVLQNFSWFKKTKTSCGWWSQLKTADKIWTTNIFLDSIEYYLFYLGLTGLV